jgi:hypothetical protein
MSEDTGSERRCAERLFAAPVDLGIAQPDRAVSEVAQGTEGLEQIKRMPCTNGGPTTYVTFSQYDPRGYKGDDLVWRERRGGELHFRGYYRPQWASNTVLAPIHTSGGQ